MATVVQQELARAIADEYGPGDRLPSEPEMAAAYRVSRATLREALQNLEHDGVVRRVHGLGTFVTQVPRKVSSALDVDLGVTEAVEAANQRLGVQVRQVDEVPAGGEIADRLEISPVARVLRIERTILANDVPAASALDIIPVAVSSAASAPYRGGSVYRFLESECGLTLRGGSAQVTAVVADRALARQLEIEEGAPLLRIDQVEHTSDDRAVLYSVEHFVPAAFELTVRRTRRLRTREA